MWKVDWGKGKTEETLNKIEKAVSDFNKYCFKYFEWIDQADVTLEVITKKMVYQYIKHLEKSYKKAAYFGESDRSFRFYPITFSSSFSSLPVLP